MLSTPSLHSFTRRAFLTTALATPFVAALTVSLSSCGGGYPANDDPQVFWDQTSLQAAEAARLHARDMASGRGRHYWVAPTGSMRPLIDDWDWIAVDEGVPYSALKAGQVIVYLPQWDAGSKDQTVVHRLVLKDSYGWILRGDAVKPDIDPKTGRNRVSEASYRVTEANYRGLVLAVYTTRPNPQG